MLERLHWSVLEFGHRELPRPARRAHDDGRGIRFHYVATGAVELRRAGDDPLGMQAGDFVLLPHGGVVDVHADGETRLLSGSLALEGADAIDPRVDADRAVHVRLPRGRADLRLAARDDAPRGVERTAPAAAR